MWVEVHNMWRVHCTTCGFRSDAYSAGWAEDTGREHLDYYADDNSMPNYSHVIEITPFTKMERD